MLRNYLIIAFRNLRRNWGYAAINLVGLTVGLAACLLIGRAAYAAKRREKEIGIWKAFGATTGRIVRLPSTDVATLVGIAFLVGAPAAYVLARWWLRGFARRVALTPWPFLAVALLARTDPATTLRDE